MSLSQWSAGRLLVVIGAWLAGAYLASMLLVRVLARRGWFFYANPERAPWILLAMPTALLATAWLIARMRSHKGA